FVHNPGATASVVGGVHHPRWGYRPFVDATLRVSNDDARGKRFELSATVRVGEDEPALELAWWLERGRGRWRKASRVSVALRPSRAGSQGEPGSGRIGFADATRAMLAFEPSGAHNLRDRAGAVKLMVSFLRDR
ncbi:MAG: hypothetical protein LC713_04995, partial [Actinobacteria bacterium]|nr:hypothetical protein [Actinomycetota bacterium]